MLMLFFLSISIQIGIIAQGMQVKRFCHRDDRQELSLLYRCQLVIQRDR